MNRLLILTLLILLVPVSGFCAIYGYIDDDGVYHMTNVRPANGNYHVMIEDRDGVQRRRYPSQGRSTRMRMIASSGITPRHTDSTLTW